MFDIKGFEEYRNIFIIFIDLSWQMIMHQFEYENLTIYEFYSRKIWHGIDVRLF